MLTPEQIGRFYRQWRPSDVHRSWPQLWNKHYRIRVQDDIFIKLNKHRSRLGFDSLRRLCLEYAPGNIYMSVLNWMMPERVGDKRASVGAYPIGGEYVIDIDSYLNYKKHNHHTEDGVCEGCLEGSKQLTERFIDEVKQNYSDLRIVFSGKSGFHIHVLDFEVRDWVRYDERYPLRSHAAARFMYSTILNDSVKGFDRHHFILSSDVLRVITFPESLNGETGLVCSHLGGAIEFNSLKVYEILEGAKSAKGLTSGFNFVSADKIRKIII
ncbi:MAG: hypothetical protein ABSA11_15415 [Candidatus Bathyarchaeia archaeon]